MARTKQYATAAERQSAYRERKRGTVTNVTPCTIVVYRIPGSAGGETLKEVIGVDTLGRFATKAYPRLRGKGELTVYVDATWCRAATPDDIERLMRQTVERNVTPTPVTLRFCMATVENADRFIGWLHMQGFVDVEQEETPLGTFTPTECTLLRKEHMKLQVTPMGDGKGHVVLEKGIEDLVALLRSEERAYAPSIPPDSD